MAGDTAQPGDPGPADDARDDTHPLQHASGSDEPEGAGSSGMASTRPTGKPAEADAPSPASEPESRDDGPAGASICDLCGSTMVEHHCKLLCPRCGYMRDCSDP
jgi:hypothetical protein